jgi:Icc protein
MKRIAWATDLHLNFVKEKGILAFYETLAAADVDAVLIAGDIAEAHSFARHLQDMQTVVSRPIYFVLGNHDYYRGSIKEVRAQTRKLCEQNPNLIWLNDAGVVELGPDTALIGHDGWADGRAGDYQKSKILLNDYVLIEELTGHGKQELLGILNQYGDQAAAYFARVLPQALEKYRHVIALTHVPPFLEACWHEGQLSDDNWAPHFTCQAAGQTMQAIMIEHPQKNLRVLCGHTHGAGEADIQANLHVSTGGAEYGNPVIQSLIEVL